MLFARVLAVGGLLQPGDAGIHLARLEGGEGAHHVDLDSDLLDPVADLQFGGAIAQPLQAAEFRLHRRARRAVPPRRARAP